MLRTHIPRHVFLLCLVALLNGSVCENHSLQPHSPISQKLGRYFISHQKFYSLGLMTDRYFFILFILFYFSSEGKVLFNSVCIIQVSNQKNRIHVRQFKREISALEGHARKSRKGKWGTTDNPDISNAGSYYHIWAKDQLRP